MASNKMKSIRFICTGNIFRSLTAEYALKQYLGPQGAHCIGSAGIETKPQSIYLIVRARLLEHGADPAWHIQRKLTQSLLEEVDCVVAMARDHQEAVQRLFGRSIPLFNQACFARGEPMLDLHEALPTREQGVEVAQAYAVSVVDHVCDAIPRCAARLPHLL